MRALVTGANKGLGKEVVRQLAGKGYEVILTARDEAKGRATSEELKAEGLNVSFMQLDVSKPASIQSLTASLASSDVALDVLVNNAGIHYDSGQKATAPNFDIVDEALQVNYVGAWRLSVALLPMLRKSDNPRIVNVSSGAGGLTDMTGGTPAYSASKAAMNVLTIKLAAELESEGFKVNSVCPGWVRTDMGGEAAPRSVAEGASSIVWAADLSKEGPTGGFFRDGEVIPW